jgi:hypothetical protein
MLMKFSMNAPAQFHAGSIQPEYPVSASESIANPYTQPVHVFSDPLLLTPYMSNYQDQANNRSSSPPEASSICHARKPKRRAGAKESSPALGERAQRVKP